MLDKCKEKRNGSLQENKNCQPLFNYKVGSLAAIILYEIASSASAGGLTIS